ncbi:hypothetical protein NUW58_g221 [Xylaria curta]|uniref:Uncharacterized protein n=1 Tax=Xylaria curta TaxID=42375 RepID=A0ACC1PSK9_9PEZI|nr:hypothetical protein NUW58_g221 [Xylaria curta]
MEIPNDDNVGFLARALAAAKRVRLKQGYVPKDHPDPQDVINKFMLQRSAQLERHDNKDAFTAIPITPSYPPSVCEIDDLVPMTTMGNVMAIVEDDQGTAVLLQLYHQPRPTEADPEDMLHPNMVLIVKEPFFKAAGDGSYSIRVDHVSDIVCLQNTDARILSKWRSQFPMPEASAMLRERGNLAFEKGHWTEAEKLYSHAVHATITPEEVQLARLNRSQANLQLHRPEKALEDALAVKIERLEEKRLFREARALYDLGRFADSLEKWRILTGSFPENKQARSEYQRTEMRIKEEQNAEYDFPLMYEQAKATPPIIDCATYRGPVAIRKSKGRGDGLFTTKPVKTGDMLLCEKAFAYCFADGDDPAGRKNLDVMLQTSDKQAKVVALANLANQVVQKLYHSPQASRGFKALYFFVNEVLRLNSFGAPRASSEEFGSPIKEIVVKEHATCGNWLLASRINHSCLENCQRSFIGDMMIIRACQDLQAGTELRIVYYSPDADATHQDVQRRFNSWGFTCDCKWCFYRRLTTKKMVSIRNDLVKDVDKFFEEVNAMDVKSIPPTKLVRLFEKMMATYPARKDVIRLELWDGFLMLGRLLVEYGRFGAGAKAVIKGLEHIGYEIIASQKNFKIRKWGLIDGNSIEAFHVLFNAYIMTAPHLCQKVKQYAKIHYNILTGADTTLKDLFPWLA